MENSIKEIPTVASQGLVLKTNATLVNELLEAKRITIEEAEQLLYVKEAD